MYIESRPRCTWHAGKSRNNSDKWANFDVNYYLPWHFQNMTWSYSLQLFKKHYANYLR